MIAVALRSMAQRKLRSALTAVAILLGVAMIAGTYVQTDQIRTAMNDITRTANSGVDAQMSPRKAFTSTFGANDLIDQRTVVRASQVPGAADVQGELFQTGSLVVRGRAVEPKFAPAIVRLPRCANPSIRCATSPGGCPGSAARSSSIASWPRTSTSRSASASA